MADKDEVIKEIKEDEKQIYFILIFDKIKTSEEIIFTNHEIIECIFSSKEEIKEKNEKNESKFQYINVFKQTIKNEKKRKDIEINFKASDDEYIIDFNLIPNTYFVFDLSLKIYDGFYKRERDIPQDKKGYFEKIDIFIQSLKNKDEEDKIPLLYNDSINLYYESPKFPLLIKLFIKTYENKELCLLLLKKFESTKDKNSQINSIISPDLENFKENIKAINEEAENLITNYAYKPINFYALILCYLNNYDYDKFLELFKTLYEDKKEILFEILIIYKAYFKKDLRCDNNFYNDFISYSASKTYDEFYNICQFFLKDIKFFLKVFEHNKEKIAAINKFNPILIIEIDKNLKLDDAKEIQDLTEKIIYFSEEKKKLLIFFNNQFWENIISHNYSKDTRENIKICYNFRNLFERYYKLVSEIYEKKDTKIKEEATKLHNTEYFGNLLDKNIFKFIENEKNITNIEIISLIKGYDVYYTDDDKYINERNVDIFNKINFESVDEEFINEFKKCNFELKFKNQIDRYLIKLFEKMKNIEDFDTILKLININNLAGKKDEYLKLLNQKYDSLINEFSFNSEKEDEKTYEKKIDSLSLLTNFLCLHQKNFNFISERINKLNKKIGYRIYLKLIEEKEIHEDLINFIKELYLKDLESNIENIQYFLELVKKLKSLKKDNDYNSLINKISESYLIETDDFYIYGKNKKLELLKNLIDNNIIEKNDNYYIETKEILTIIYNQIKDKKQNIEIKNLDSLFTNDEKTILERLDILNKFKIQENLEPKEIYEQLKKFKEEIDTNLNKLTFIKESLEIYYNNKYKSQIIEIKDIIGKIKGGLTKEYEQNQIKIFEIFNKFMPIANNVNKVKKSKIFEVFYKGIKKKNFKHDEKFESALKNYEKFINALNSNKDRNKDVSTILNSLKDEIGIKEQTDIKEINKELLQMTDQKDGKNIEDNEFSMFLNLKFYEEYVNSIFYFFNNFKKNDEKWENFLLKKYMNLSQIGIDSVKIYLKELKEKEIYDYKSKSNGINYLAMFKCLYKKNQAYDFLLSKNPESVDLLIDRIDGRTLTIKDIRDTSDCIGFFRELKNKKDNFEIFKYVKENMKDDNLNKIINFSRKFASIINLYENFDNSNNIFKVVKDIISSGKFIFRQDTEEFSYYEENKEKNIKFKELKSLNNKIHIRANISKINDKTNSDRNNELIYFKNLFKNIEVINEYMFKLRKKGSCLPINISISAKQNENMKNNEKNFIVVYKLEGKEMKFEEIKKYLSKAFNDLRNKIDLVYKELRPMRFLYGKQIASFIKYLVGYIDFEWFLRYILNETDNKKVINKGEKIINRRTKNYVDLYDIYNDDIFKNISNYIISLLENNGSSLEKHYKKILIKNDNLNKMKGIYLYKSESNSIEEDILQIFLEHTRNIPIAQNILVMNKETSLEEIQAFFNRAILCDFNTLFVIQLNKTFSDYQQKIMIDFMDKLLIYKNEDYNNKYQERVRKNQTGKYIESCIIFIYNNKCNESFLNEILKLEPDNFPKNTKIYPLDLNDSFCIDKETLNSIRLLYENTHIITSEICGLGKSTYIKSEISKKSKKYVYLPLGGNITKDIIYNKLNKTIKEIKTNDYYNDIAIHLDLYENNEDSIVNEFLFSFLITKFYSNNENIIYIPKNIEIFIEIPNCFYDFKANYEILNSFKWDKIKLEELPKLKLSKEKFEQFRNMLEKNSLEEISKYIYVKMGKKKFSYHQINIFINLFLCQYGKFSGKLIFYDENNNNVTDDCIKKFAEGTKYFTCGGFSKNLIEDAQSSNLKDEKDKSQYINLLSEIYDKDLESENFKSPLIFIFKKMIEEDGKYIEKKFYTELDISENGLKEYKTSKDFLEKLKFILNMDNPVEHSKDNKKKKSLLRIINEDKYVITKDNFKKMVLILYRIIAKIPVILMGETGCGKTALIKKLNQLLNNGKETLETINIHPGIDDEFLIKKMNDINKKAKENPKEELWVFFDELNTCNSLALLTEIFINRSYNSNELNNNIKIIGACNPYRKRRENKNICGLTHPSDENELIYAVNILPQSLMYYVFNFSSINSEDEKKYISSIISELFSEDEELLEKTTQVISKCHEYFRDKFDISTVSLREMKRFKICCKFFTEEYYPRKNEYLKLENNKILEKLKSIIISIYICYYTRLIDNKTRNNFEEKIRFSLIEMVNYKNPKSGKGQSLLESISNPLYDELKNLNTEIENFSILIEQEEKFLIQQIDLGDGIGNNKMLRENLFLLFISLITNIPLIIIGKPGSGKSLSVQLICKVMKGKYSNSNFFKYFPYVIQSYFQGSFSTTPEEVKNIFDIAEKKLESFIKNNEKNLPISMIFFDELGLADKSKYNPLKVLHSKLDQNPINDRKNKSINIKKKPAVSFVGISNYIVDAAKTNRAFSLSVPDLDTLIDELVETSKSIVESIEPNLMNDEIFTNLIPRVYNKYKEFLRKLKILVIYSLYELKEFNDKIKNKLDEKEFESLFNTKNKEKKINFDEFKNIKNQLNRILKDKNIDYSWLKSSYTNDSDFKKLYKQSKRLNIEFHGNRDFYYLIKGIANDLKSNVDNQNIELKKEVIEKYITRNFSGLEIELDIDLSIELDDTKETISFLTKYLKKEIDKGKIKISSESFFKKVLNYVCDEKSLLQYHIEDKKFNNNEFLRNIINNINDPKSRYMLIQIKSSLGKLIFHTIKNSFKNENTNFYEGSPFSDDNGSEYRYKMINIIQENAEKEGLIVLQNLNQIYPFLYDLFNMNYIIKDEKKYARIYQGNFNDQLVPINDMFRIIVEVDKKYVNNVDPPFLNRFEKLIISFDKLLEKEQKDLADIIYKNQLNFKDYISQKVKAYNIKYQIIDLIIGNEIQDIQALIFYYYKKNISNNNNSNNKIDINEDSIEEKILKNAAKLLPQDIVSNLPIDKKIVEIYNDLNKTNLNEYLKKNDSYKIYIIYTFSIISTKIDGIDESSNYIIISGIRSEEQLKNRIDEIINRLNTERFGKKKLIILHFEQKNSKKLSFIIEFLNDYYKITGKEIKFLLIIHIKRNFDLNKNESIYSVLNIYDNVEQIFLDDLNGKKSISKLLSSPIKDIINNNYDNFELERLFFKILNRFLNKYLSILNIDSESYTKNLINYYKNDNDFLNDIIEKAKSSFGEEEFNIIEKIYTDGYVDENTSDIVTVINDYIKEKVIGYNIENILLYLEDQNILTSMLNAYQKKLISKNLKLEIQNNYLNEIDFNTKKQYNPKFNLNLIFPGFYSFYIELSNYISSNISYHYNRNEKKIRKLKKNFFESEEKYHAKELELLLSLYKEVENKKFIVYILKQLLKELSSLEIVLNDYISYYLQKYMEDISFSDFLIDDIYKKLINYILDRRFKNNLKIMEIIKDEPIKILLLKIIWLESNSNYLMQIIKVYSILKDIFSNKDELFKLINNTVESEKLKYLENGIITSSHNKEVNECYYIILGSICLSVMPDKSNNIKIEESKYFSKLKDSLKIIDNLNNDLLLYLNEMYMIDELIQIYNVLCLNNKMKIEVIIEFSQNLIKNNQIIQSNLDNKSIELTKTINDLYNLIKNHLDYDDNKYYDLLNYIFYKEIKKVEDIDYRISIFEHIIKESELIIKSNDILKIFFQSMINTSIGKFQNSKNELLKNKKEILTLLENNLKNPSNNCQIAISETLFYFFEKNSLIYLNNILNFKNDKKKEIYLDDDEDEKKGEGKKKEKEKDDKGNKELPLPIFKDCLSFLKDLIKHGNVFEKDNKNITKLFCISYIKAFCFKFISLISQNSTKIKNQSKIIEVINESKNMRKIVSLYLFKIIYNQNKKKLDIFLNPDYIQKYKLNKYTYFKDLIIHADENPFIYKYINQTSINSNQNYENYYEILENYKKGKFNDVDSNKINIEDYGLDIFYFSSCNMILSCLKLKNFGNSDFYINFYKNVCIPLFKSNNNIFPAIQIFYDPEKFENIKKNYGISPENIEKLLYSYRYCLNELNSNKNDSVFGFLYNKRNIDKIKDYYFPGNDIKNDIKIYELYSKINEHFKTKKENQGCFVCLCEKGYYHSVFGGYPNEKCLNMKCEKCGEPIGSFQINNMSLIRPIKREKYYRIFKDKEEINNAIGKRNYNYMTINQFKEKYINQYYIENKGINKIDGNHLRKDNKVIRNLSQVSYRLLNFILYSHLFFSRLYTENKKLDNFLPEKMSWIEVIKECWELLKMELNKEGIISMEIFMNYIFFDLFKKINNEKIIDNFKIYMDFEASLDILIKKKIEDFKKEYKILQNKADKNHQFLYENLLEEMVEDINNSEYPYYNYFIYSDYINEEYLIENLHYKEKDKYPVLSRYLEYYNSRKEEGKKLYQLKKLKNFNEVLNLFNDNYSNSLIRRNAEERILNGEQFYSENKENIDKFIKYYNNLNKKDENNNILKLSDQSQLSNFFVDDLDKIGKTYKDIYFEFIKEQNNQISKLLEIKIEQDIFDNSCKTEINIQSVNEDEIFILDLPEKFSFIDVLFNSSYRKMILNGDYKSYNQFEIDYDLIEERMTDVLLKNKKLFNKNINNFIYNNENLIFENTNALSTFKRKFSQELSIKEKIILYTYYNDHKEGENLLKNILKDFKILIIFYNNNLILKKNEKNSLSDSLTGNSRVSDTYNYIPDDLISKDFKEIFNDKSNITIDKIESAFEFYLLLIFENMIIKDLEKYQNENGKLPLEKITEYLNKLKNDNNITKEDFSNAIRLFISLFLYNEEDKENKIKNNSKNISFYLDIEDLWDSRIFNNKEALKKILIDINELNISINQIIPLYRLLEENIEEKYLSEVKDQIERDKIANRKDNAKNLGPPVTAGSGKIELNESSPPNKVNENEKNKNEKDKDNDIYDKDKDDDKDKNDDDSSFDEDKYYNKKESDDDDDDE